MESLPETCMWNMRCFWEFQFSSKKCRQRRPLEKGWNFDIFSKLSKIHETYRIYWNHYQKHACEIWGSLEKLQCLTEKCCQRPTLEIGWTFDIFSKVSKIHKTYRIYWNQYQKHACEIWGGFEKFQFSADKCRQRRKYEILTFSQSSPKFMKLTEFIGINTRNMHVKFEAVWRSYNFWQKNADSVRNRMKFWHFLKVLGNSWNLQNLLESLPGTCMWNLKQFGEVSIFDRKMPTAPDLRKRMEFWHFSKFSGIHETYRIYWNHLQEHACEIWSSLEKFQFLTEKCRQCRTLEKGWTLTFSQSSPKFMKLTEFIGLTSRNMHVKFGAV